MDDKSRGILDGLVAGLFRGWTADTVLRRVRRNQYARLVARAAAVWSAAVVADLMVDWFTPLGVHYWNLGWFWLGIAIAAVLITITAKVQERRTRREDAERGAARAARRAWLDKEW